MKNFHYHLIFHPEKEGGFTVTVPALPGCVTYGKTLTKAKKMAGDAINGYIVSLQKHNELIPSDNESFIASIDFQKSSRQRSLSYA